MLIFIKDLGMIYATDKSKRKNRYYLVLCSGCNEHTRIQASQFKAGYTEYCMTCSKIKKKGGKLAD
jgi:hypothetical protein